MTAQTLTLTDFLLARIAEDEYEANVCLDQYRRGDGGSAPRWRRQLAECVAKRAIVEWHKNWPVLVETQPEFTADATDITDMTFAMSKQIAWKTEQQYRETFGTEPPTGPILRALASVYADHPDYREEWAIS